MRSREQLMQEINQASFCVDDAALYLDTHPHDVEAMRFYHEHAGHRKALLEEYAAQYGPLLIDDVTCREHWTWVDGPFPWEGGMC